MFVHPVQRSALSGQDEAHVLTLLGQRRVGADEVVHGVSPDARLPAGSARLNCTLRANHARAREARAARGFACEAGE